MSQPLIHSSHTKATYTISEYGLIGVDESVKTANRYLSEQVQPDAYRELEAFAKSDEGSEVLRFHGNGRYLQAKNYVGTIKTVGGYMLEILPKTTKSENPEDAKEVFIKLLHILHKLPSYKHINKAHLERLDIDIFEVFIAMFLEEVGMIIKKGLKSDYIEKEENLFYLKGKLLIGEQIKYNTIHKEMFFVRYDNYLQDRPINRLIKSTLLLLSKLSSDYQNLRLIRLYMEHMGTVSFSCNHDADFRKVRLERGMEHYANAHVWTRVFLKNESFSTFGGDTIAFALLYPMEKLFECFVEWWLLRHYRDIEVISQHGDKEFVEGLFGVRPDFILQKKGKICCIADAKWKVIDKESDLSQSDFYQLYAYANLFQCACLRLFYPKTEFFSEIKVYTYLDNSLPQKKIVISPLDIKELLSL